MTTPAPHPGPIQAVAFDLGGVIYPWPAGDYFTRWEERLGSVRGSFEALLWHGPDIEAANVGALSAEEYVSRCAARLGADERLVGEMIERAFASQQLNEELISYARLLRKRVRVAALTNNWSFGRRLAEERGIADLFDVFVNSAEEGVRKPDREIFEVLLQRLDLVPSQVVFVDDARENVEAARSLGFHVIEHVSNRETLHELDRVIPNIGGRIP